MDARAQGVEESLLALPTPLHISTLQYLSLYISASTRCVNFLCSRSQAISLKTVHILYITRDIC